MYFVYREYSGNANAVVRRYAYVMANGGYFKHLLCMFSIQIQIIVYYVMRSKNEVLCAPAGRLAAERSEADEPAKAHKTIFAPNNIYYFFLQTFITNYLRHVKKPGRNFK
jgi:hypothetical protein